MFEHIVSIVQHHYLLSMIFWFVVGTGVGFILRPLFFVKEIIKNGNNSDTKSSKTEDSTKEEKELSSVEIYKHKGRWPL